MFLTLYKTGRGGNNYFYTLHNLQPGLFHGFCLTVLYGKVGYRGYEKKYSFETEDEREQVVKGILAEKKHDGYKLIYNYPKDFSEMAS